MYATRHLRIIKFMLSFLIIGFICMLPYCAASAKNKTIRVGIYQVNYYHYLDESGTPCGYEIDYLNRISEINGWNYKYVILDNWSQGEEYLKAGRIDLLSPAVYTQKRGSEFLFSDSAIGECFLMIETNDKSIGYDDYGAINGLKIGYEKNTAHINKYDNWANVHNISADPVGFDNYTDMMKALEKGEIDAVLRNTFNTDNTLKTIAKIGYYNFYFIMNNKNTDLKDQLDDALTQIVLRQPDFQANLQRKYFPTMIKNSITAGEREYVNDLDVVKVAVAADRKPMIYVGDDGKATGIAIEIMNKISDFTGLRFEYVPYENVDEMKKAVINGACQLEMPAGDYSGNIDIYNDMVTSNAITESVISIATMNGKEPDMTSAWTVGVTPDMKEMGQAIRDKYSNCEVREYDNWDEACRALMDGNINSIAVNSATSGYLFQKPVYRNIRLVSAVSIPMPFSVKGYSEYGTIIGIINKGIRMVDSKDIQNIYSKYSNMRDYKYTFSDYLYMYRNLIISVVLVVSIFAVEASFYLKRQKQYEKNLLMANKRLETANAAKSEFLSRMSHDIRTPMNGIIGLTSLAQGTDDLGEIRSYLRQLGESEEYLLGLLNDILNMSKIEEGKTVLKPEYVDTNEFIQSIINIIGAQARDKGIDFQTDISGDKFTRYQYFDPLRVKQIIINLLNNAVKYTPKGGTVNYTCCHINIDGKLYCHHVVTDNGIGMSDEFMKKMFEPFSQEKNSESINGTGLGLAISKKLVELMNGTIAVDSMQGEGTAFTVDIPTICVSEKEYKIKTDGETTEKQKYEEKLLNGLHILICEDNEINSLIAATILEKKGCIVECEDNGRKGADRFEKSEPGFYDVILMDIRMPVMDGLETTKTIRAMEREDASDIPIIAMSANAFTEDVQKSLDAGMNAHLKKPVDPELLYKTIAKQIQKRVRKV